MRVSPAPGDIPEALRELKITFRLVEDEAVFLCPYHDDHHAGSFSVNIETGMNHCFACGQGGGFTRLVQVVLEVPQSEADRWVRSRRMKGMGGTPATVYGGLRDAERHSGPVDTSKVINEASLALFTDPPAWALAGNERWVGCSLESAQYFGVLWNPENDSWIIPIRDAESHKLIGWQEKGSGDSRFFRNVPEGVAKSSTLFGLESLEGVRPVDSLVLVESPLDVLRLFTAGIRGGVSGYGVHVSSSQLGLLAGAGAGCLVLALDNDFAGSRETLRIVREFRRLRVVVFNYGRSTAKDPGEQQSDDEIHWGIDNAIWGPLWRP